MCVSCGAGLRPIAAVGMATSSNRIPAALCAIFLGSLGVHKFIVGYNKEGIIMLLITLLTGWVFGVSAFIIFVVGVIGGIIYLSKSDVEFYETYVVRKKSWF
jgi:TM2 domain-containing membrane protein YozV